MQTFSTSRRLGEETHRPVVLPRARGVRSLSILAFESLLVSVQKIYRPLLDVHGLGDECVLARLFAQNRVPYEIRQRLSDVIVSDFAKEYSRRQQLFVQSLPCPRRLLRVLEIANARSLLLSPLTSIGVVEAEAVKLFKDGLRLSLVGMSQRLVRIDLSLKSNSMAQRESRHLPAVDDKILEVIGRMCRQLEELNVSYTNISIQGLECLVPIGDYGCPELTKLHVFECRLGHRELAALLLRLDQLTFLGYKETGRVVKYIHESLAPGRTLRLTHLNNQGSKSSKLVASGLRCRRPMTEALAAVLPDLCNLKVRVTDSDVRHLIALENLQKLELLYYLSTPANCAGPHTASFLCVRGDTLTSLAIINASSTLHALYTIARCCPNLEQLWNRCNMFTCNDISVIDEAGDHNYLTKLTVLYFRVGENNLAMSHVAPFVLRFLLKNASRLRELILPMRAPSLLTNDNMAALLVECNLTRLEKLMILLPGVNDVSGALPLTTTFLDFVLGFCPVLKKLGNLMTWRVSKEDFLATQAVTRGLHDLELIFRVMMIA